jgi:hypothetical protein
VNGPPPNNGSGTERKRPMRKDAWLTIHSGSGASRKQPSTPNSYSPISVKLVYNEAIVTQTHTNTKLIYYYYFSTFTIQIVNARITLT